MKLEHALAILRYEEQSNVLTVGGMFRTRHDGVSSLDIKIDVMRTCRKRAEALRAARKALGDDLVVSESDTQLFAESENALYGRRRWGREFEP